MAYTKSFIHKCYGIGIVGLLILFLIFMVVFSNFCYNKGLDDARFQMEMQKDSTFLMEKLKELNSYQLNH